MKGATPVPGPIIITGVDKSFGKLSELLIILASMTYPT